MQRAVLDTVRRASRAKIKNGSFAADLRFVHISRYAIKSVIWALQVFFLF